jgi:hypothetical protein
VKPARRYLTIIQAAEGYPPPGAPREAAPPDGPAEPVVHTVVMADAYEALEAENARLRPIVAHVAGLTTQDADGYSKVHRALIDDARAAVGGADA